jgi:hypothetical protein
MLRKLAAAASARGCQELPLAVSKKKKKKNLKKKKPK